MTDLAAFIAGLPKAELHVHHVGSASPRIVSELAQRHPGTVPADPEELRRFFEFRDFAHFIEVYLAVVDLVRTPEDVRVLTYEVAREMALEQHLRYAELTCTPYTSVRPHEDGVGMPIEAYTEALEDARVAAERDFGLVLRWIYDIPGESGLPAADATLIHSASYTMLAPICTVLDALTLLSLQQHAAVLATAVLCVIIWRVLRALSVRTSILREAGVALATLGTIVIVYGTGAVIPRPMAAIMMHDPNDVVIDFHSHTNSSWDGRSWFTPERNRAWHAGAGFDVAYITDHKSLAGALAGMRRKPT